VPGQTDFPLPPDLPRSVDDGAADNLAGQPMLIEHVIYPVFPPNESAGQVIEWLRANPGCERLFSV